MKRHPLAAFFILALLLSWLFWIPLLLFDLRYLRVPLSPARMQMLGSFGPCVAALIVAFAVRGMNGLKGLFERLLIWRVHWFWYLAALGLPSLISLLVTAIHMGFGGEAPDFSQPPIHRLPIKGFFGEYNIWTIAVPLFLSHLFMGTAIPEEMAWRGFALPRLQQRTSAWLASLVIAVAITIWMLPWTAFSTGSFAARPLFYALFGAMANALLATWLFNNSRGSLLIVVLFNNALKVTELCLATPAAHPGVVALAWWLVALAVLLTHQPISLSRQPLPQEAVVRE